MGMCGTMISDVYKADEQPGARSQLVAAQAELEISETGKLKSDFCIAYIPQYIPYPSLSFLIIDELIELMKHSDMLKLFG